MKDFVGDHVVDPVGGKHCNVTTIYKIVNSPMCYSLRNNQHIQIYY